jgi:4-hydroxy-2-oxoheptanedioate aldolase
MKALDAGAYGVIVPMVNSRQEALAAVSACRYPPEGQRSFGPTRAALYAGKGYAREANRQIACIAMIETRQALDNLDEIVTTPGLDGVYIGPADLALALGLAPVGDNSDPDHAAAITLIFETSRSHGLAVGIHTWGEVYTRHYLEQGFHFVTLGSDSDFMARTAAAELQAVRKLETKR